MPEDGSDYEDRMERARRAHVEAQIMRGRLYEPQRRPWTLQDTVVCVIIMVVGWLVGMFFPWDALPWN